VLFPRRLLRAFGAAVIATNVGGLHLIRQQPGLTGYKYVLVDSAKEWFVGDNLAANFVFATVLFTYTFKVKDNIQQVSGINSLLTPAVFLAKISPPVSRMKLRINSGSTIS
jgi:hypothetical protein